MTRMSRMIVTVFLPLMGVVAAGSAGAQSAWAQATFVHPGALHTQPPLASSIVDDKGVKVLDDWITSLTTCP